MSSQSKTPNLQLNQWAASDPVVRTDFNADNARIDAAVGGIKIPVVKLMEVTTAQNAASVELNFAGVDLSEYRGMDIIINACGVQLGTNTNESYYDSLCTRINKDTQYYSAMGDQINLCQATLPRNVNTQYPPDLFQIAHIRWSDIMAGRQLLFGEGNYVSRNAGASAGYTAGTNAATVNKNLFSAENLNTVDFVIQPHTAGEAALLQAGAKFTVYGIRK